MSTERKHRSPKRLPINHNPPRNLTPEQMAKLKIDVVTDYPKPREVKR